MSNLLEKASILLTPTACDDGKILSVKPIDGSGDFDFTRNSSATRVNSQGLIEDMQILSGDLVTNGDFSQEGSELITNGDFASPDISMITGAGVRSIVNGELKVEESGLNFSQVIYNNILDSNKIYKATFDITLGTGSYNVYSTTNGNVVITESGTHTFYLQNTNRFYVGSNGVGDVWYMDNVSVKEVGQDWTLHSEWSIGTNKAIYDNSGSGNLNQSFTWQVGKKYKITFDIGDFTTNKRFDIYSGVSFIKTATTDNNTSYTILFDGDGGSTFRFRGLTTESFSITNISIIEITDDTNLPRIDYSPYSGAGTCGHWLFEPQSTNLMPYSEDATNWSTQSNSVLATSNQAVSPDGTLNADKLIPASGSVTSNGGRYLSFASTASTDYSVSIFVKQAEYRYVTFSYGSSAAYGFHFDLQDGVIIQELSNAQYTSISREVESFTNGWYRLKISLTDTISQATRFISVRPANELPTATNNNYATTGDGTSGIYVWGFQIEQGSYATSYIPTSGSTVTRNQEAAFGAGNSSLINSTEGVLYLNTSTLVNTQTIDNSIALTDGGNNKIIFRYRYTNGINVKVFVNGVTQAESNHTLSNATDFNKIAIKWKLNDYEIYVNGISVFTDNNALVFPSNSLNSLDFDALSSHSGLPFYGKTKCVAVFKEALTDDELECLTSDETSFSSFNALALANNYTII